MDNEQLLRRAESHQTWRRVFLVINGLAYIGWIGSEGMAHANAFGLGEGVWNLVKTLSWPVWLVSLCIIFWQMRHLFKNREIGAMVDDERTEKLSARSFQVGYWTLLVAITGLYTASYFVDGIDVRTVVPMLLAAGVTVPAFTYAFFHEG